jgi:hypothetical protein
MATGDGERGAVLSARLVEPGTKVPQEGTVNERECGALGAGWRVSSGGESAAENAENAESAEEGEQGGCLGGLCVLRHEV